MSLESQLFEKTRQYLSLQLSFDDLARWVQIHEIDWTVDPQDKASELAGTIMLAAYEVWEGNRPAETRPDSARALITEDAARILGASSRP